MYRVQYQQLHSLEFPYYWDIKLWISLTFEEENLIFPETNEISLNKEDLRTCINYGQILKAEEVLFNEDKSKLDRVKEYFLEHGEEISSTDEEWMSIAKGIKLEMDRLLQDRIKWEKDLEIYLETCQ
jgi:hypothetical protein